MDEVVDTDKNNGAARKLPSEPKQRRSIKSTDVLFIVGFVVIVGALTSILISKLELRFGVAHARTVSNQVIDDIQARNGGAARALGTPDFQKTYSTVELNEYFKDVTIATLKPPTLVDTVVANSSIGRTVFFVYDYNDLKVPYFIRTSILDKAGKWQLTSISGNASESELLGEGS